MIERRGLVLGGGGITGIAWEAGLLFGLQELGVDLLDVDLVVGTSAGSVVGAQISSGVLLVDLYERQLLPPQPGVAVSLGAYILGGFGWAMIRSRGDVEEFGRRLGQWSVRRAASGKTPTLASRYEALRVRIQGLEWPSGGRLVLTAVDVETGQLRTFDGTDGVSLLDAVVASCAVPGVYPPVPIGGRFYIDGGARSGSNADLAARCSRVVALTPVDHAVGPIRSARQLLGAVPHVVVSPDEAARAAIGGNVLDPRQRAASARAGRAQAASVAEQLRALWRRADA